MKRIPSLLPAVLLGCFTLTALAAHTHAPTPSTWELNVTASDFEGGPTKQSDRMTILVDTDQWLKCTHVRVDGDGKRWNTSWSGPQDGTMKPIIGMPGAKASFKTEDDSSIWELPNGSVSTATMALSPDKKRMTIHIALKTKDGKEFHQTLVYDRVK